VRPDSPLAQRKIYNYFFVSTNKHRGRGKSHKSTSYEGDNQGRYMTSICGETSQKSWNSRETYS